MAKEFYGIVRRVDDLGRIVIPRDLRRRLRVQEGDAIELNIAEMDGKRGLFLCPYTGLDERMDRQAKEVLKILGRQLPEGYEIGLLFNAGVFASIETGYGKNIREDWPAVNTQAHDIFKDIRDGLSTSPYLGIDERPLYCYPVKTFDEPLLLVAILGDVSDNDAATVKLTANMLAALL